MSGTARKPFRTAALATLAAAAAIALGAFLFFAPYWQPGRVLYTEPLPDAALTQAASRGPIDVNTADAQALQVLPGIGEAKAQAIIDWRQEHGPFNTVEELENVPGISARMVESWQGLVTAGENDKEA